MREVMVWVVVALVVSVLNGIGIGVPVTSASSVEMGKKEEGDSKGTAGVGSSLSTNVQGTIRVLNEILASSPADVHMSERGVRGTVKEVWSRMKKVGRNVKKMIKLGNERMIGKGRSQDEKVFIDGNDVVVAVKGRDGDGRNETREMRIKIDGKYDVENTEWGTKILGALSEKKMKLKKEIERDLRGCEKMKDANVKRGDVECMSGIVKKLKRMYNGSEMCRKKKEMQNIYECLVKMLQEMDEEGSYLSKNHGRSMLSWSGWMEAGNVEKDDEEEGLEDEEGEEREKGGGRRKMVMYIVFVVMLILVVVCLNDLKRQCGRYRQERRRVYEIVRLPEYAQTIYSRMIRQ